MDHDMTFDATPPLGVHPNSFVVAQHDWRPTLPRPTAARVTSKWSTCSHSPVSNRRLATSSETLSEVAK